MVMGKSLMTYLTDEGGNKIYERKKINKLAFNFFRELYTNKQKHDEKYKPHNDDPVEPFMYEEIEVVVKKLKKRKSPGA